MKTMNTRPSTADLLAEDPHLRASLLTLLQYEEEMAEDIPDLVACHYFGDHSESDDE